MPKSDSRFRWEDPLLLEEQLTDEERLVRDTARDYAHQAWNLLRLTLPLHTFDNGVFCTGVQTVTAPFWGPATGVYRRSASYRVILHGVV